MPAIRSDPASVNLSKEATAQATSITFEQSGWWGPLEQVLGANSGGGGIAPFVISGNFMQAPATGGFDTASGALNLGTTNATTITIGRTTQNVVFAGTGNAAVQIQAGAGIDTAAAGTLFIAQVNATQVTISANTTVSSLKVTQAAGIDMNSAAAFNIGATNAQTITIGRSGQVVALANMLDLTTGGGTTAAVGGGVGDKIALNGSGASAYAIGVQSGALVLCVPVARVSVRQASGAGNATSGTEVFAVDNAGHLFSSIVGAPATSNLGANVTSATFTGNDTRGTISVVMSGALAANTRIFTATFSNSYGANPPKIFPINNTSGAGLTIVNFYISAQSTGVSFDMASDQALATGTYIIGYIVFG